MPNSTVLPLRKLRDDQVTKILQDDPALAHAAVALTTALQRHGIITAWYRQASKNAEYKHRFRAKSAKAGVCLNGRTHGLPTHGQLCDECYDRNQANQRARRAAKKGPLPHVQSSIVNIE